MRKYYAYDEQNDFQQLSQNPRVGWIRDIPSPYQPEDEDDPRQLQRSKIKKSEYQKDRSEMRMLPRPACQRNRHPFRTTKESHERSV